MTVNAYHPGVVNTDLHRHMPFKQSTVVRWSFTPVLWMLMKGAKDGAQTPVYMAVSQKEEGVAGKYYRCVQHVHTYTRVTVYIHVHVYHE